VDGGPAGLWVWGWTVKPGRQFPGVGTGAVVVRDGSLLMVQRAGAHGAGTWSVPGGWVEFGENPLDGAVREVKEETGITVAARVPMGWTSAVHPGDEDVHAITLWVRCNYVSGEPTVVEPDKCPVVEWVTFADVAERPLFQPFDRWWPTAMEFLS
jgi:8-oxo-dGTP diphosphatase